MAHAKVTGVDKSAAEAAGAQVFVAGDTDLGVNPPPPFIPIDPQMHRPLIASDTVRFVGDIVAIVLADSREASVDAAELVMVDYDPLPAVTNPEDAARDETVIYAGVGTNVCLAVPPRKPTRTCSTPLRSSSRARSSASGWRRARSSRARARRNGARTDG